MNSDEVAFLLNDFTDRVYEVTHVLAVSADGLLVACNDGLSMAEADRLAAIASGLVSLLNGAARALDAAPVASNLTELNGGYMFSMSVSSGASLLALASFDCDIGQVGHELTSLIQKVGPTLSPSSRTLPPGRLQRSGS